MKRIPAAHFVTGVLAAACLLIAPAVQALLFTIEVDTSPLIGHPAGPFSLEFQLNDGSGTNDGNNTALIGPFDFHGGSEVGAPTLVGGASGDLGSHVVLADEQFLNEFFQEFDPGPLLTFDVDLSPNVDPGPQPDQFSFAILDCDLIEIPTGGPADALVLVDIANPPRVRSFNGDVSRASDCGGQPISIRVLEPPPEVPEPGIMLLMAVALTALTIASTSVALRGRRGSCKQL